MDVAAKLADMDAAGIERTMISINDPGPETFAADGSIAARICNDWIADLGKRYPARFSGLAVLPLQNMNAALKELDRCVSKLGMKGILLYSNLAGKFPDEEEFRELFAEAERRDMPILLHPAHPVTFDATEGHGMTAGLGLMFDTTIALARIILAGILERHPRLKLVCPHAGGALPYLIGRIDHQTQVLKRGAEHIAKPPSAYLRQIYLDAVSPIPLAIQYASTTSALSACSIRAIILGWTRKPSPGTSGVWGCRPRMRRRFSAATRRDCSTYESGGLEPDAPAAGWAWPPRRTRAGGRPRRRNSGLSLSARRLQRDVSARRLCGRLPPGPRNRLYGA